LEKDEAFGKLVAHLTKAQGNIPAIVSEQCFNRFAAQKAPAQGPKSGADTARDATGHAAPPTDTECTVQRNQAVAALVISSETLCLAHRRSMYGNDAASNITFGTLTNVFAAAASTVTNEKYRPIYAALALFSNSERSLINETVYKQMLVTAVDKKLMEIRDSKMQGIYRALEKPINEYGMNQALSDVTRLHTSCSFMDGLQKALEEGTQNQIPQKILRLRETLRTLNNELEKAPASSTTYIEGLKNRINLVSNELAKEEVK
jgi:hypothetical protein